MVMANDDETCRPIPAPRRLYPELQHNKSQYENVTVHIIDKNLNINVENLQQNSNCKDKIPNNKVFLAYSTTTATAAMSEENMDKILQQQQQHQQQQQPGTHKVILTETNDLYGPNANELVPSEEVTTTTDTTITRTVAAGIPMPTPRLRKPQNCDKYENVIIKKQVDENAEECNRITKEVLRPAPQIPTKNNNNTSNSNSNNNNNNNIIPQLHVGIEDGQRIRTYSMCSEMSTTSTISGSSCGLQIDAALSKNVNATQQQEQQQHQEQSSQQQKTLLSPIKNTNLQSSNSSLTESLNDSTDSTKYKSPSPSDLFKSLGNTSKLLTESIGERVACKAKGAKQKLDRNLKNSSDLLSNIGSETTQRLKKLSSTFTLTKRDKLKNVTIIDDEFDGERPQTVPPNSDVFNTISFNSPLQYKSEGRDDLRHENNNLHSSYEVPRSLKSIENDSIAINTPFSNMQQQIKSSSENQNRLNINRNEIKDEITFLKSQNININLNRFSIDVKVESTDNTSIDSTDIPSPPMPTTPAPILAHLQDEVACDKLNIVQAPARQKKRKNYEEIQLRQNVSTSNNGLLEKDSNLDKVRMNIDSTELQRLNAEAEAREREESLILRQRIEAEEKCISIPERSNSWEYHEEHESESSSESEPIYANQETTYGNVFEMATSNKDLLTPQNLLVSIIEENSDDNANQGAVGGHEYNMPNTNVIQEFDPLLVKQASTICHSDKSNQLLLLEYLLEQETYGTIKKKNKHSSNLQIDKDKLNENSPINNSKVEDEYSICNKEKVQDKSLKKIQIVHQNAHLRSDSTENILASSERNAISEQNEVKKGNCIDKKMSESDNSTLAQTRSQWFIGETKNNNNNNNNKSLESKELLSNSLQSLQIDNNNESPPSYQEAIGEKSPASESKSRTFSLKSTKNVLSNVKSRVDALKRKTSFKLSSQKSNEVKVTLQMVPRPSLSPLLIRYEGPLVRFPSGMVEDILKEMQNRKAVLRERQFQTFLDHEMKTPKEAIPLEHITTIQCISNSRITDNATLFYCFEITTATPKNSNSSNNGIQYMSNPNLIMTSGSSGNVKQQRNCHLYGVSKESERGIWMQKLLESLTNAIPNKYVCQYYRAGWCYLKYSITSDWSGTWLVLKKSQRRLIFVSDALCNIEKVDLRKARCIVLKESDDTINNLHVESGPILMIDAPPFTLYLIMSSSRETKIWRHIISEVAHNNGFTLTEQQLTKFNVPVIVDKCINFIYIHGSMSEGIYRKSGSENSIHTLMAAFRADAFSVEITRNEYNEHDVANVLKRFMRDLPERLMGKLSDSFMCVAALHSNAEKIHLYRELLARLNVVEYETLKKIINHLAFISSQRAKNKMNIQNLTMIWGPTLMQGHQQDEMIYSQREADVISDLINNYKDLFPMSPDEMKKEQAMLNCLQKYYAAAETLTDSIKKSGDLKIWITLNPNPDNTKEEKTQINVTVSPTKTAYEVCKELAPKMNLATHQLTLHESILNGNLERPLHYNAKIFDVILNWSYWPDDDRKNNMLVVKPIELLNDIQRAIKNSATITPGKELKFADKNSKTFKVLQCDLRDGKIVITKKEKNEKSTIVKEIFLHGCTVYLGCEKKRELPWSWAITFVEIPKTQILRSRESPFIGHVLAGTEWVDRTIWYSSIWYSLYGDDILPPAEIIIK